VKSENQKKLNVGLGILNDLLKKARSSKKSFFFTRYPNGRPNKIKSNELEPIFTYK